MKKKTCFVVCNRISLNLLFPGDMGKWQNRWEHKLYIIFIENNYFKTIGIKGSVANLKYICKEIRWTNKLNETVGIYVKTYLHIIHKQ